MNASMGIARKASLLAVLTAAMTAAAGVTVKNDYAAVSFDDMGRVTSIRNLKSGRELLRKPGELPFAFVCQADAQRSPVAKADSVAFSESGKSARLDFRFKPAGSIVVDIEPRGGFFLVTVKADPAPAAFKGAGIVVGNVDSIGCDKYIGRYMSSMVSDDADAVMLRPVSPAVDTRCRGNWITGFVLDEGVDGKVNPANFPEVRVALVVREKSAMIETLKRLTVDTGMPRTSCGGAWSLEAPENRTSYLHAYPTRETIDRWIALAQRMGYKAIHIEGWWESVGTYTPTKRLFPGGMDDLKACFDKISAAGLTPSFHTLSGGINVDDPFIRSGRLADLQSNIRYTLAKDLPASTKDALFVQEPPADYHDTVLTYHSRGNVLRIGNELVQYSEVQRGGTNAFARLTRGALGTPVSDHKAGEEVAYLRQSFFEFFPEPNTPLADSVAANIGKLEREFGASSIYLDGTDGLGSARKTYEYAHNIVRHLKPDTQIESSVRMSGMWWFTSRIGAWDNSRWAPKRFHDLHLEENRYAREAELLVPQMGWWAPKDNSDLCRGHFPDEIEYFACKNLGIDGANSVQEANVTRGPLPPMVERQLTLLGRWERLRLARYFDDETTARCAVAGDEYHLVATPDGEWRLRPVKVETVRALATGDKSAVATLPGHGAGPLDMRLVLLDVGTGYTDKDRRPLFLARESAEAEKPLLGKDVTLKTGVKTHSDLGFESVELSARNGGRETRGAYAGIERQFRGGRNVMHPGFACWVKGDGSGAILDLQVEGQREYASAASDHIVKVDWTGWRLLTFFFRERDAEARSRYVWPYHQWSGRVYRTDIQPAHIGRFTICLNELPVGRDVNIEVSDVYAIPRTVKEYTGGTITVNGKGMQIPFPLASREFVEIGDGVIRKFGVKGDMVEERPLPADLPMLADGVNTVSVDLKSDRTDLDNRIDVTVFNYGGMIGRCGDNVDWNELRYDYDDTVTLTAPCQEGRELKTIVRKEHNPDGAALNFQLVGPLCGLKIKVGDVTASFPDVAAGRQLDIDADGKYRMSEPDGKVVKEGVMELPFPRLDGGEHSITLFAKVVRIGRMPCSRISWFKDYGK